MNALIIEDELLAQEKLEAMLLEADPEIKIIAKTGSVKDTVKWLSEHPQPDLAFVDIQLSDDHSFEIFRKHPVNFPVIFTTAFDKYVLETFEFNSIDYLLKPITKEKLKRALEKVKRLELHFIKGNINKLINGALPGNGFKERIIGKKGTEFTALENEDIAFFYTEHKVVFVKDFQGRQFIVDENLGELELQLDERKFFRINRKYLCHHKAIERFKPDNGKIRVYLQPEVKEEVHVSKETAPMFREWIAGRVVSK